MTWTMRKCGEFYPWASHAAVKPEVSRRERIGGTIYHRMTDGSIRNPDHERHERKALGLSARQHKRLKKAARRGQRLPAELRDEA